MLEKVYRHYYVVLCCIMFACLRAQSIKSESPRVNISKPVTLMGVLRNTKMSALTQYTIYKNTHPHIQS